MNENLRARKPRTALTFSDGTASTFQPVFNEGSRGTAAAVATIFETELTRRTVEARGLASL